MRQRQISGELLASLNARGIGAALETQEQLLAALQAIDELAANGTLALELSDYVANEALRANNTVVWVSAHRKAVEISPDPISLTALANCLEETGDAEAAMAAYSDAVSRSLTERRLIMFAALEMLRFCVRKGKPKEAGETLQGLIAHLKQYGVAEEDIPVELDVLDGLRLLLGEPTLVDEFISAGSPSTSAAPSSR